MGRWKKFGVTIIAIVLTAVAAIAYWGLVYTDDLPAFDVLERYAPSVSTVYSSTLPGMERTELLPAEDMGGAFRRAIVAAEPPRTYPTLIARSMLTEARLRPLPYNLAVVRLSWHIRHRFSDDQLLTIYANTAYFEDGAIGIAQASMKFFHKEPSELTVDEAAFLAALLRSPRFLSQHPEQALARRNTVLQEMVARGTLSQADASEMETRPLPETNSESRGRN